MRNRLQIVIPLLALLLAAPAAWAQHHEFGQFLSSRISDNFNASGSGEGIQNPTGLEMYAMRLVYDETGELAGCDGQVIPPHGSADNSADGDPWDQISCDFPCNHEIIAVPATGEPQAGNLDPRFGVILNYEKSQHSGRSADPATFVFADTEGDTPVADCVCAELCEDSQDEDLLDVFGFDNCGSC